MRKHGTKPILVFLTDNEKASWLLLSTLVSLLSSSTVQQENSYSYIIMVTSRSEKVKKG